jgi:hypothetical protein
MRRPYVARTGRASERAVALFLLSVLAFSPFVLSIFNVPAFLFGIPLLYVYLFLAWGVVIALLAMTAVAGEDRGVEEDPGRSPGHSPGRSPGHSPGHSGGGG